MSSFVLNSTQSEIRRGCIFSENFEDYKKIIKNNGIINGNPHIYFGMETDGTDDKITYLTDYKNVKAVSFWVTLATTTEDIMQLSSSHSIEVSAGTLTATGFSSPTIWINGVATSTITTNRSFVTIKTATEFDADDFIVGQDDSYGQFKIEQLRLWDVELVLQEHIDFYNNETYRYMNKSILWLPMTNGFHDPDNNRVLDISGNSYHNDLGNGAGSNEPTKLLHIGYETDGTQYLKRDNFIDASVVSHTVLVVAKLVDFSTDQAILSYEESTTDTGFLFLFVSSGTQLRFYVGSSSSANAASSTNIAKNNILVLVGVHDGVDTSIWINGTHEADASTPISPGFTSSMDLVHFARGDLSQDMVNESRIFNAMVWDFALTPLQINDLYLDMKSKGFV